MKKIICSILVLLVLVGCSKKEVNEKELITQYIENNEIMLIEIIDKINNNNELKEENIINSLPKGLRIYSVYKSPKTNYINFSIDEGTTTSSHYYGFYYTPSNIPLAGGIEDERLKESGNGFIIQEAGNEDWYYTEKIIDNFFFYEDHY